MSDENTFGDQPPDEIPCADGFWYWGEWVGQVLTAGEGGSTGPSDALCPHPASGMPRHPGGDPEKVGTPDDFCWDAYYRFGDVEGRYNPGDMYRFGECDLIDKQIGGTLGWVWSESEQKAVPVYWYNMTWDCSPNREVTCYKEKDQGGATHGTISPSDNPAYTTNFFVRCGDSPGYEVLAKGKKWHPCATVGWMYGKKNFQLFEESYKSTVLRIQNEDHQPNLANLIEAMGRLRVEAGVVAGVMAGAAMVYVQALADARNLAINFRNKWPYIPPIPSFPPILP